jgi:hypothetical protein
VRPADERPGTPRELGPTAGAPAPRVADLDALLRDLDALRLSVSTDLTLAAAALDAGSPEVAGSIVDSDRATLLAFEHRALRHLQRLRAAAEVADAGADAADDAADVPADVLPSPVIPGPRPRSRASRVLLPAGPLLATAAAILGVLGGVVPSTTSSSPATSPASTSTAVASYAALTRLTLDGADADEVRRAAEQLHDELEIIVAQAGKDPVAAQEALALLESETLVLVSSADRDALTQVIAEARAMVARLKAALPPAPRTPRAPAVPVRTPDVRVFEVPPVPDSGPPAPPAPEPSRSASPQPTPSPAEPSPAEPSPAEPSPADEPNEQPAPEDSEPASPEPSTSPQPALPGIVGPV